MDSEKKATPIVFQEYEKATAKSNKKYVIAAVTVVLILVITLGAVMVTLKLTNRFAADTIKEYRLAKKAVVKIDKENEITEFVDPKMGYSAYNDFNLGLTMMKVVRNESYVCYINTLSRDSLSPEALESYMEHHPDGEDLMSPKKDVDLPEYMPAKEEISDRRFLSEHLRETCEGFPIHWLVPAPANDLNGFRKQGKQVECEKD
ncbi:unnamed protein product [Owenia fusiformis]|uniref:Uncharacterized protein n=1 Tax=Owenia fusiformis TaxID=6347 RepID=A0A8J1UC70_OWEFU|nr:unnamed protein product [Owenia fusiformis]